MGIHALSLIVGNGLRKHFTCLWLRQQLKRITWDDISEHQMVVTYRLSGTPDFHHRSECKRLMLMGD